MSEVLGYRGGSVTFSSPLQWLGAWMVPCSAYIVSRSHLEVRLPVLASLNFPICAIVGCIPCNGLVSHPGGTPVLCLKLPGIDSRLLYDPTREKELEDRWMDGQIW